MQIIKRLAGHPDKAAPPSFTRFPENAKNSFDDASGPTGKNFIQGSRLQHPLSPDFQLRQLRSC
jgi:hypothetical protein